MRHSLELQNSILHPLLPNMLDQVYASYVVITANSSPLVVRIRIACWRATFSNIPSTHQTALLLMPRTLIRYSIYWFHWSQDFGNLNGNLHL